MRNQWVTQQPHSEGDTPKNGKGVCKQDVRPSVPGGGIAIPKRRARPKCASQVSGQAHTVLRPRAWKGGAALTPEGGPRPHSLCSAKGAGHRRPRGCGSEKPQTGPAERVPLGPQKILELGPYFPAV